MTVQYAAQAVLVILIVFNLFLAAFKYFIVRDLKLNYAKMILGQALNAFILYVAGAFAVFGIPQFLYVLLVFITFTPIIGRMFTGQMTEEMYVAKPVRLFVSYLFVAAIVTILYFYMGAYSMLF